VKKKLHLYFEEPDYMNLLSNTHQFRAHLSQLMSLHPELFPSEMLRTGYDMHDIRYSKQQDLPYRRIRSRNTERSVFTIVLSFIMPYWVRSTQEAGKGLLMRYTVHWLQNLLIAGHKANFILST
jgi:hypothetical protein